MATNFTLTIIIIVVGRPPVLTSCFRWRMGILTVSPFLPVSKGIISRNHFLLLKLLQLPVDCSSPGQGDR